MGRLVTGNEADMGSSYQNGRCVTAQQWAESHGDAGGRRGGVLSPCSMLLGCGGSVVASATLTLVEVGAASTVMEKGHGAVPASSTPCEEMATSMA